jgi:dynein heavy chain
MMAKVDQFLDCLINYEKENIHPAVLKELDSYLADPEFEPEFVRTKSGAAAGLCSWVINVVRFYEVYCDVEPKRRALQDANNQLKDAQNRLAGIIQRVAELEETLKDLTDQYKDAVAEKVRCQDAADATSRTISLANRLVGGLGSENVRWGKSVGDLKNQASMLPGDVLLVASFIAYLGSFTKQYRTELLEKKWMPFLKQLNHRTVPIPMSQDFTGINVLALLTDDATIAGWNNEGLPSDAMSTENATILTQSIKWPLMIDPQLQGIKWIKNKYGKSLNIIRLGQKNFMDIVERWDARVEHSLSVQVCERRGAAAAGEPARGAGPRPRPAARQDVHQEGHSHQTRG